MSDEEFDNSSSDDSEVEEEAPRIEFQRTVGKSLRNDATLLQPGKTAKVTSKDALFNSSFQLPLGAHPKKTKRSRDACEEDDFTEEMDAWLAGEDEEEEEEEAEMSAEEEEPLAADPVPVVRPSSLNPKAVLNQRKTEADVMKIRIHLQPLLDLSAQISSPTDPSTVSCLKSLLRSLLKLRGASFATGCLPDVDFEEEDLSWEALSRTEDALWPHHSSVIEAAERRLQLTSSTKSLRTLNRGTMEQVEAVLSRRAEIKTRSSFLADDQEFYSLLLRDFVSTRAPSAQVEARKERGRRADYHRNKKEEAKLNYTVHNKLVNFVAPVEPSMPTLDVDQLVKSLFK